MALIYETRSFGAWVKVFSDHVEYKPGLGLSIKSIPIQQITSIELGHWWSRLTIETTGRRKYAVTTDNKNQVAVAIGEAQAAVRLQPWMPQDIGSVADELSKMVVLRERGALSDREFDHHKRRLLGYCITPVTAPVRDRPVVSRA